MREPAVFEFEGMEFTYDKALLTEYEFSKAFAYLSTGDNKYTALFYDEIFERLFGDNYLEYWDALGGNEMKVAELVAQIVVENRNAKN